MAKDKQYTIKRNSDNTLTLTVGGVSKTFRNTMSLASFAQQLYTEAQNRWVGMFRLQDTDDGHVDLIFNKGGEIIRIKDYEQAQNRQTQNLRPSCGRMSVNLNSCSSVRTECPTTSTTYSKNATDSISTKIKSVKSAG